jgi:uncharacterized protein YqgV (UPF0045/DUF77 family)
MADVTVAVECIPLCLDPYPVVDEAIAVIKASGVTHEVTPMETVMQGNLDTLLEVVKAAHRRCLAAGADKVLTIVKISDAAGGSTIADKMAKYR